MSKIPQVERPITTGQKRQRKLTVMGEQELFRCPNCGELKRRTTHGIHPPCGVPFERVTVTITPAEVHHDEFALLRVRLSH